MNLEENKMKVTALLNAAFTPGRLVAEKRAAMATYINPVKYIQHSAVVPDGFDGLMSLVEKFDQQFQSYAVEVKRLIAEGDYVWAHCHYTYGPDDPRGKAIVEIFRFEEGLMVEHWDVIQDVPADMAHTNGIF
ncbi:polyketide cyclase [Sphingomonas sp. So64.6b]|uniref:nuclear transport factor 2 family protein n=1 Tax=Sphingomonas sp. So64.6b TaxID=2997354 RepID=UPI001602FBC4|nr:ester cyclase [Sphingomonas sp. So64.6b]QNA85439.1 polyketide cyclase [Sphingomonas sp. So64.6b]